jgi:hypothetical protein
MKLRDSLKPVKGILFAGCSFTWGQGLYYYSGMSTLKQPPANSYKSELVTLAHEKYMESIRFPRLVADHFNTFELCQPFNGGASYSIHDWWCRSFMSADDENKTKHCNFSYTIPTYHHDEISHVIYQFTQWHRAQSPYSPDIHKITHSDAFGQPGFQDWLKSQNLTLADYEAEGRRKEIQDVKDFLMPFEKQGIRVYVMSWPYDIVDDIINDPWLSSRFMTFDYKGRHYTNIESMMEDRADPGGPFINPELTINRDTDSFETPPEDHHPSKTCHRVIADTVINYLKREQNERTQTNTL